MVVAKVLSTKTAHYPARWMCRLLRASSSGYYAWRGRSSPEHAKHDGQLAIKIKAIFDKFDSRYGSPRILDELLADGERVSRKRVIRFMHEQDLCPRVPKQFKRTTDSAHNLPVAKNLVDRDFSPDAPGKLWAGDITHIRTWEGWLYLVAIVDLFSHRVAGWAMADDMRTELPLDALKMAASGRSVESVLVHHSSHGSQYASDEYQEFLELHGMTCGMSRKETAGTTLSSSASSRRSRMNSYIGMGGRRDQALSLPRLTSSAFFVIMCGDVPPWEG